MVRDPETRPVLRYVYQQIRQFQQLGEVFMVQHTHIAEMDQEYAAFKEAFVDSLTLEERLAGLSPEDIRRFFPVDDLLDALTPEERRRLFERLCAEGFTPPAKLPGE